MITQAQADRIAEIKAKDGFVQAMNDPECDLANRAKPAPAVFIYLDTWGVQSIRIGTTGKLLAPKIS